MIKPKILLIYSNENDRRLITALLNQKHFNIERTLHVIEKNSALEFCPEIVLIQTALYQYEKTVADLKEKYPNIREMYLKTVPASQHFKDPYYQEIINFLYAQAIHKKHKLIDCIKQIEEKPFTKTINCYELQL